MNQDTSAIACLSAEVSTDDPAVALLPWDSHPQVGAGPGLSWGHAATALLLLLTLPVFMVAAVLALPALVLVATAEGLRKALAVRPIPHHASFR